MEVESTLRDTETISTQNDAEKEPFVILQKLMSEEAKLVKEKKSLISLKEKIELKVQRKIRRKKKRLKKLRDEIKELRFSCDELSKSFRITLKAATKQFD
jgi:hypothetical protein